MAKVDLDSTNLKNGFIMYINDAIADINKIINFPWKNKQGRQGNSQRAVTK